MFNLRTITLNSSLYSAVPILLSGWGLVFACHVHLISIPVLFAVTFLITFLSGAFLFFHIYKAPVIGELSIVSNQAVLIVKGQRFVVEFESFNGWRLVARVTLEKQDVEHYGYFKRLFSVRARYIAIYHSTLSKECFAYLRSFAAYQHFTK